MPNPIKYTIGSETDALKKGNFYIGTGDVEKGPTSSTGYYSGINPPNGGYTVYVNKALDGPSIITPSSDAELIGLTNSIAGQSFTSATECLVYYASQNDKLICNIEYPRIITNGLVLNVDAGFTPSYPTSGVTWYDIGGINTGTSVNGTSYNGVGGGSMVFDGVDDYISTTYSGITGTNPRTISIWFRPETSQNRNLLGYGTPTSMRMWDVILYNGLVGVHLYSSGAEAGTPYTVGVWQNIVFTFTYPTITSYMDGVFKSTYTNLNINTGTDNLLSIAKGVFASYFYYNGLMGPIQIYNKSLTAQEVLQNYNVIKNRYIFTSTWNTANTSAGSSTSTQVKLPLVDTGTYNMLVDWGDGTTDTITTWNQAQTTHTYTSSGVYEIKISGRCRGFRFAAGGDRLKLLNISQYGILDLSTDSAFYLCTNFNSTATDAPTISTTSLVDTFRNCTNFNGNIGNWNVSNVTNMQQMFLTAASFNNGGSPSINNWNTSNVTNMLQMFREAGEFDQNIGNWDVSNVTIMNGGSSNGLFFGNNMKFNNGGSPSINNWNISKLTSLELMFSGCFRFNQPLENWNTSNITNMAGTFNGCSVFNQNLSSWDTSKVTTMVSLFFNNREFNNGGDNGINNWNTSNVTNMQTTFSGARKFNQPLNDWNTSKVTSMQQMFLENLVFNQPLNNWNTSLVTSMLGMFRSASLFNQDISNWNISNVTTMGSTNNGMFINASSFNQNLGAWNLRLSGVSLQEIFLNTNISCQNYTDTIVGWANKVQTNGGPLNTNMTSQSGRRFDGTRSGGAGFVSATDARLYLTTATPTGAGWTINGDTLGTC